MEVVFFNTVVLCQWSNNLLLNLCHLTLLLVLGLLRDRYDFSCVVVRNNLSLHSKGYTFLLRHCFLQ